MPVGRIVSLSLLGIAAAYVAWIQAANPTPITLPGLGALPVWGVVTLAALIAFLAAWLPARLRRWRERRERTQLERRVAELESH
ncbi:MAG: lipopolysaccharide assembly protein LapA domain-containing protein, partial [Trueperaceae bacterium]|nr:lipopolysaccharide assembly protein LapA domain-containing protein [Trueperaceae bacterium]